jgi:hypothetical protein
MNNEQIKIRMEAAVASFRILFRHSVEEAEEDYEKPQSGILVVWQLSEHMLRAFPLH